MFKKFAILLGLTASLALAGTITYTTPVGAKDASNDLISASATVVTGNGTVTVTLTNSLGNIKNAGELLSDFLFTLSITPGTALNTMVTPTGSLIDVTQAGNGTASAGTPTAWQVTSSGATIHIDSLFDGPAQTIIGPGPFSNPNNSITGNHNPFINQTAVFSFNVSGVTSDTRVTAATFSFGTDAGDNVPGTPGTDCTGDCGTTTQATPEPFSFFMVGGGLVCAGVLTKLRRA